MSRVGEQLLHRDVFQLLDVYVVLFEQRPHPLLVAGVMRLLNCLNVAEAVGLLDKGPADDHDEDRYDAQKEDEPPTETYKGKVYPGREEDSQWPPTLDNGVQESPTPGGDRLVDERYGDGELRLSEPGGEHAYEGELPEGLHEECQACEEGCGREAQHPHALPAQSIHPVAHEQGDHELRRGDEEY